jgi:hypothetical protein
MASLFARAQAAFMHPEHGWKSTHFWGPIANWGLVGAAVYDANFKGPETIDIEMTGTMIAYSSTFMLFFWKVQPRNLLGFSCHVFNVTAQLNQMRRAIEYKVSSLPNAKEELTKIGQWAAIGVAVLGGLVASAKPLRAFFGQPTMPETIRKVVTHPAGPLTVFFWAPASKWMFSVNNLKDLNRPVEKISLAQMGALTFTGFVWTRYSFVIIPVNYNLAAVNFCLGLSSGWHLLRKVKAEYFADANSKQITN